MEVLSVDTASEDYMRPTISILFTYVLHKYNVTDQLSVFILFSSIFVIQLQVSSSGEKRMYLFLNICQTSRLITRIAVWLMAIIKSRCCFIVLKQTMQRKKELPGQTWPPLSHLLLFILYWLFLPILSLFVPSGRTDLG